MSTEQKPASGRFKKFIIAFAAIVIIALAGTGLFYYLRYFGPNVTDNQEYLYIKTGSEFEDVYTTIREQGIVKDTTTFRWAAINMKYPGRVKPGKYKLTSGLSNRKFINMLAAGNQEPVKVTFKTYRLKDQFAGAISKQLEADSISLIRLLDSAAFVQKYNLTPETVYTMFLPDSYEFYWNTSAEQFVDKMHEYYDKFWTAERKQKAADLGLTQAQVSILASIVDWEALHDDEMPAIAGLYLNRLKKGIKLQADPTVIFSTGDFTIRRVLNRHLITNSPYNTYLHTGLPPGPIMLPSVNAVKAVLDPLKSNYIYMCAKEDFSGYHNFADNEAEHRQNARRFQKALDERNIKK
ncbi:MAG: endolytic transglycosylase MltG [Sphingobacteriaceae bacterium]|nr:MAG: endolytic transglycosylase MltG [Sphingobacteriaceae bacterium]